MTGFLTRLIARERQEAPLVRPRPVARFEPTLPPGLGDLATTTVKPTGEDGSGGASPAAAPRLNPEFHSPASELNRPSPETLQTTAPPSPKTPPIAAAAPPSPDTPIAQGRQPITRLPRVEPQSPIAAHPTVHSSTNGNAQTTSDRPQTTPLRLPVPPHPPTIAPLPSAQPVIAPSLQPSPEVRSTVTAGDHPVEIHTVERQVIEQKTLLPMKTPVQPAIAAAEEGTETSERSSDSEPPIAAAAPLTIQPPTQPPPSANRPQLQPLWLLPDYRQLGTVPAPPAAAPTINVTIGRIEIKAQASARPPRPAAVTKTTPVMSLETYLKLRSGGQP